MSPQQLSKAHALEENGGPSTLMEHQLMSQSSSRLSWRRMFSLQGRTGAWIGRADSCSTGSPPPPSPPPPPSQPPSVSTVSPAPRLVAASAANLSTWSSFYLLQCLTDIHFVNSKILFHEPFRAYILKVRVSRGQTPPIFWIFRQILGLEGRTY